jgi:hypothetical protein
VDLVNLYTKRISKKIRKKMKSNSKKTMKLKKMIVSINKNSISRMKTMRKKQ